VGKEHKTIACTDPAILKQASSSGYYSRLIYERSSENKTASKVVV